VTGIYFVGSHSSGKTSLVRWVSDNYKIPIINEVARTILSEMEVDIASLRLDIDAFGKFQTEVLRRQVLLESQQKSSYVSDRAFDSLAYAAEHTDVTKTIFYSNLFIKYVKQVNKGLVFFIRPCKSIMVDDGVRESVNWDDLVRIDGMIKVILKLCGTRYIPIESSLPYERVNIVRNCIDERLRRS